MDVLHEKTEAANRYDHSRLESRRQVLRYMLRSIGFTLFAKVGSVEGIENVPKEGPAILMYNHISMIDTLLIMHVLPRNIVPMAKVEAYDYPVIGIFPKIWDVISVRRGEIDRKAILQALDVLKAGEIISIAPEGTRSPQLLNGKEGIAYLASRSGVPVIPVAISDTRGFPTIRYSRRWHGPGGHVRFGLPFQYKSQFLHAKRGQLRIMTDEAMYILASMLPEEQRGVYHDFSLATRDTIEGLTPCRTGQDQCYNPTVDLGVAAH